MAADLAALGELAYRITKLTLLGNSDDMMYPVKNHLHMKNPC